MAGEAVVINRGVLSLTMRATMAMASIYAPMQSGGRLLEHGGLSRPLPAQVALELGVDVVVCSDVTYPFMPPDGAVTFFDRFASSLSSQGWTTSASLQPENPLGLLSVARAGRLLMPSSVVGPLGAYPAVEVVTAASPGWFTTMLDRMTSLADPSE